MHTKKIIIIGGGMAGLCAGSYLQMNGYDVTIFETNGTPGGVCTSWQRGKYTVDLCIHWLVGSGPASSFYERWSELIDLDEIKFVNHDEFFRVEDGKGNYISVFADIDKLEKEFSQKALPKTKKKSANLFMPCESSRDSTCLPTKLRNLPMYGRGCNHLRSSCRISELL